MFRSTPGSEPDRTPNEEIRLEPGQDEPRPPVELRTSRIIERLLPGLDRLLRAYEYAADVQCGVWEFAVELRELLSDELTRSDLRWLLQKGYAEHAREVTLPGDEERAFHAVRGLSFLRRSCFVLTKRGAELFKQFRTASRVVPAQRLSAAREVERIRCAIPRWDSDRQELRVDGQVIKQFKVPAPNQEMILAAFEEEGWPPRIDDPLPPQPDQDPKRRLHDTINSLNRNHRVELLRFIGDGSGTGIRWETGDV